MAQNLIRLIINLEMKGLSFLVAPKVVTNQVIGNQSYYIQGPPNTFFLENALKKTSECFLKFIFLFVSTILPVNNGT